MTAKKSKKKVSNFSLAATIKDGLRESGSKVLTTDELEHLDCGIPLTGMLPLELVMRVNVLPMNHFFTITGEKNAGKSNLMWALFRRVVQYGGICLYMGSEPNENVPKQRKIIGYDPDTGESLMDAVFYHTKIGNLDQIKSCVYSTADQLASADPSGKVPLIIGLDSLGNVRDKKPFEGLDKKEKAKAEKDTNMDGATKAKSIKAFLGEFQTNYLNNRPVTMVVINHQQDKISTTGMGGGGKYNPGGVFKDYMNSNTLVLRRENKDTSYTRDANWQVYINNRKQHCGAERNVESIVPFTSTWYEQVPSANGETQEVERGGYDWNEGLVKTLMEGKYTPKDQVKEVVHLVAKGQLVNCGTLGLTEVTKKEAGAAIHANEDICEGLRRVFNVTRYSILESPLDG